MRTPRTLRSLILGLAVVLSTGAGAEAADAPKPAAAAKAAESPRAPDATERAAMLEILKPETAPHRGAWLTYSAGDAEGKALAESLAGVFKEAGWKAETSALSGMRLKPGVMLLVAEESPPTWVQGVQEAMSKSGLSANAATGYRAYYDEKKAENPSWAGVPLPKDAAFVIVVGPEPKS